MAHAQYKRGDKVSLKDNSSNFGIVVSEPREYSGGLEYKVFINNSERWYAEDALLSGKREVNVSWIKYDPFLRHLLISKLSHPLADSLYSYRASRTAFAAYQFRPALKFLNNPEQRLLIADEVGLGKTIEACIIYLELKARLNISQVMIICPSRLTQKWQDELRSRFEEDFHVLDSNGVRRLLKDYKRTNGAWQFRSIVSFETLRRENMLAELMETRLNLDLLIVDEAHHMRNQDTSTHRVGAVLTDTADAAIYLTATPLHLGNDDLYNLLYLLSPGDFNDRKLFGDIVAPNKYINSAISQLATGNHQEAYKSLLNVEQTRIRNRFLNNPYYHSIKERLSNPQIESNREEKVYLQRDLMELNTLSNVFTRTRKREVSHAAVRAAHTITVQFTPEEAEFYYAVLEDVREQLRASGYSAISFATVMKERMAASCLIAMRQVYENSDHNRSIHLHMDSHIYDFEHDESSNSDFSRNGTQTLLQLASRIGNTDSKFDKFINIIETIHKETPDSKILVFSSFRKTLSYLYEQLEDRGYKISTIHGDVKMAVRQSVIEKFKVNPDYKIMLSSEVGAEGLDFQFCDVLINYDLPWNPMKVEQRIGRLDRFGQTHDRIRIYNFYIQDSIETRILQRLYNRINIFNESIGDLEAILGEEVKQLSKEVLQARLTPIEEQQLAEEAANRIAQLKRAEEELDKQKDEFLGQDAILNQQVINTVDTGRVIHSEEIRAIVETYVREQFPRSDFVKDYEEPTWSLSFSPQLSASLRQHKTAIKGKNLLMSERFQQKLVNEGSIALTFDNEYARQRPLLEFITYNHLLADAAIQYWKDQQKDNIPCLKSVVVKSSEDEEGDGYFFIYALDEEGITSRRTLKTCVVRDDNSILPEASKTVLGQLYEFIDTEDIAPNEEQQINAQEIANNWIATHRDKRLEETRKRNQALVAARVAAVEQSFDAKIRRAQTILSKVTNKSIRNLYDGQIRNLEAQKTTKVVELQDSPSVDVSYQLVAMGRVRVIPEPIQIEPEQSMEHPSVIIESTNIQESLEEGLNEIQMIDTFDVNDCRDTEDIPIKVKVKHDELQKHNNKKKSLFGHIRNLFKRE